MANSSFEISPKATLKSIDSDLRSARTIIFWTNVVCAFLFILVFRMVLGWQMFRPAASEKIFSYNLAGLALSADSVLTPYEKCIDSIAVRHCEIILKRKKKDWKNSISLAEQISASISAYELWHQDAFLRDFIRDVNNLDKTMEEWLKPTTAQKDSVKVDSLSENYLKGVRSSRISEPMLSFRLQQILDRYRVNEDSRMEKVTPRMNPIPGLGIPVQMEDVSPPIAIFLIILSYWTYTCLVKAYDSTKLYIKLPRNRRSIKDLLTKFQFINWPESPVGEHKVSFKDRSPIGLLAKKAIHRISDWIKKAIGWIFGPDFFGNEKVEFLIKRAIDRTSGWIKKAIEGIFDPDFFGQENNDGYPVINLGIVWLFLSAYLVVASSIMANAHEIFVMDYALHGTGFIYQSSTVEVFVFTIFVLMPITAVFLAGIGRKTFFSVIDIYEQICDTIASEHSEQIYTTQTINEQICDALASEHSKEIGGTQTPGESPIIEKCRDLKAKGWLLYIWILAVPFIIFGTLSSFQLYSVHVARRYFFGEWFILVMSIMLLSQIFGSVIVFSSNKWNKYCKLIYFCILFFLPLVVNVVSLLMIINDPNSVLPWQTLIPTGLSIIILLVLGIYAHLGWRAVVKYPVPKQDQNRINGAPPAKLNI